MHKWPLRTDALACWKLYVLFVVYLVFLSLDPNLSVTTVGWSAGAPSALNRCYIFLQFIACFFVAGITADLFEETFRNGSCQYIQTFPMGTVTIILFRYLRLLLSVLIPYVPTVLIMFTYANKSIQDFLFLFPEVGAFPSINPLFPLIQCLTAINFYILATMFFLFLFKSKMLTHIVILTYCALEATMLHFIFPQFVVFRGSFNSPDFYSPFPINTVLLAIASVVMLLGLLLFYPPRRKRPGKRRLLSKNYVFAEQTGSAWQKETGRR